MQLLHAPLVQLTHVMLLLLLLLLLLQVQALRVSVGKLGIIARVQFRIVREVPVRRVLKALTPTELLALMHEASDSYKANSSIPHWMNETQIFWVVQKNQVGFC
jgi:FAD/FMN-containing dehydrogenase